MESFLMNELEQLQQQIRKLVADLFKAGQSDKIEQQANQLAEKTAGELLKKINQKTVEKELQIVDVDNRVQEILENVSKVMNAGIDSGTIDFLKDDVVQTLVARSATEEQINDVKRVFENNNPEGSSQVQKELSSIELIINNLYGNLAAIQDQLSQAQKEENETLVLTLEKASTDVISAIRALQGRLPSTSEPELPS